MITDHLGNKFKSIRQMYLHYGLNESLYYQRRRLGMTLEEALTKPRRKQKNSCVDDTLVYKRHQVQKRRKALRVHSEKTFKTTSGSVTVKEWWRG